MSNSKSSFSEYFLTGQRAPSVEIIGYLLWVGFISGLAAVAITVVSSRGSLWLDLDALVLMAAVFYLFGVLRIVSYLRGLSKPKQ
jgi:hypothetical protein